MLPNQTNPTASGNAAFVSALFGRTAEEDLARIAERERDGLAASALAFMAERASRAGMAHIRIQQPGAGTLATASVIDVVNDDRPFLLDSTLAELQERGIEPLLVAHPILAVRRDPHGKLLDAPRLADGTLRPGETLESLLHIHVPRLSAVQAADLEQALALVYRDVHAATADWQAMRARVAEAIQSLRSTVPGIPVDELAEAIHFLEWLVAENFTFLGLREYAFSEAEAADPQGESGLGILRDPAVKVLRRGSELVTMTPEVRAFLREPMALIIAKANVKSRIHRRVHMDYVGVKLFDGDGRLTGELRLVGLFTSTAYNDSVREIPYIRHKVARVIAGAGYDPASHSGKALINVLESYPRDELFQLDQDTLAGFAADILALAERPRLRALARVDRFDRFVSVLVFIPKDRYDTSVRRKVGAWLAQSYGGRLSAAYPAYPEGPLARTHYIIGRDGGVTPAISRAELEAGIHAIVRTWADGLQEELEANRRGEAGMRLLARYGEAFGAAYREAFSAAEALADIAIMERLTPESPRAVDFYRRRSDELNRASLKVYSLGQAMPLSQRVPLLEGLGFTVLNERTYRVAPAGSGDGERIWLHDMTLEKASGGDIDIADLDPRIEAALMALFRGQAEADAFNALVTEAGLGWRESALLRALARYCQQIGSPFTQSYLAQTLRKHAPLAAALVALFRERFDPHAHAAMPERLAAVAVRSAALEAAFAGVQSLDEDRILRRFKNLIEAAVRTNFYQLGPDGRPREVISFKFEAARVEGLPLPRPLYEIFLHSPRVDGVHLRFGRVARGGIRWSDRPQDFRTEVLGLVKAQQVKNAVIVPVGAKGGFVPKRLPPASDRAAWLAEGTEAYKLFIASLLHITDNLDGDRVVPPVDVVRHDGDDPYLVVAADKGTATFSDTANGISEAHGHWLGDAFASGGSAGYDHKKMGITARGGWEAVKRHFRELDTDIQTTPFTVVGVGDMSGDVFGNGMLLSPAIKLVAAFDHRDIFLDPTPDPAASLKERQRLFALPRSSWADYDASLISAGGGVFSRSAKQIPLSAEAQAALGLAVPSATPQELMTAILKAPVDLLWFGGIGTYVRASSETDADAGDRANDPIRVTGTDVRARVIGEGANLGMTQRARIELAHAGVRLNTDAIDNSAGVNSSDVEVNIKIATATPVRDGRLTLETRNVLLASMTDDVAALVLRNNYLQTLALSLAERKGAADVPGMMRLMRALEADKRLDRAVEYLPADAELVQRAGRGEGLTRPELAVLLAYAKLALHDALVDSEVPDDAYLRSELNRYFPVALRERFPDAIEGHRLRREIVATQLANAIINRGGPGIVVRLQGETGRSAADIARAYALARDVFGILDLNNAIDALDARLPGAVQNGLYAIAERHVSDRMLWFLRHADLTAGLAALVARFRPGVEAVKQTLAQDGDATRAARIAELVVAGVPQALAADLVHGPAAAIALDATLVAERSAAPVPAASATLLALADRLHVHRIKGAVESLALSDDYERLALQRALAGMDDALRRMAGDVLAGDAGAEEALARWLARRGEAVDRASRALAELAAGAATQARVSVAAGLLADLAQGA